MNTASKDEVAIPLAEAIRNGSKLVRGTLWAERDSFRQP